MALEIDGHELRRKIIRRTSLSDIIDPPNAGYEHLATEEPHEEPEARSLSRSEQQALSCCCLGIAWRDSGLKFISSTTFQIFVGLLIVLNSAVIGMETDHPEIECWDVVEHAFLLCFAVELLLRLTLYTPRVFLHPSNVDLSWNLFDVLIVGLGVVDFIFGQLAGDNWERNQGGFETVFRMIRMLRVLRMFRIVRFVKQLYVLAYGFALAGVAVFWVTLLMASALYICSVLLVRLLGQAPPESAHYEFFHERFGSIPSSMFTLFQLAVQPNLKEYRYPLMDHPFFLLFFIVFVFFGSFGMIALMTGVLSEAMFEKNMARMEEERVDCEFMVKELVKECSDVFDSIDRDENGETRIEDVHHMRPKLAGIFEDHKVPYTRYDLEGMISVMDTDGSGKINRKEFCRGILQIAQDLRPMLVMQLHYEGISFHKARLQALDTAIRDVRSIVAESRDAIFRQLAPGSLPRPVPTDPTRTADFGHRGDDNCPSTDMIPFFDELRAMISSLHADIHRLQSGTDSWIGTKRVDQSEFSFSDVSTLRAADKGLNTLPSVIGRFEALELQSQTTLKQLQGQTRDLTAVLRESWARLGHAQRLTETEALLTAAASSS